MGVNTLIRKAQAADIPAIQTVARLAWEHTYKETMKPATRSRFLDEFYNYDALAKALKVQPGGIWVAEQQGKVVGFIQVVPMLGRSGLELSRLYVVPEHQRQGVGQSLVDLVGREYPTSSWWALVERNDNRAVEFYRKNGYEERRDLILNVFGEDLKFIELFKA